MNNIPARCGRFAPTTAYLLYPHNIPVTNGGFSDTASFNGGRATVTLSGSFTNHNLTVSGHLHIKGALPGCASANTGAVAYSAKH